MFFLGNHIGSKLLNEIKSAKYFNIMCHRTPEISDIEQMSGMVLYVKTVNRKLDVKEVFLVFFPFKRKIAVELCDEILEKLKQV